jgi:hypothetical protein
MQTKYTPTPGPWHLIHDAGQLRVDSERDGAVAVCYTLMRGEFKAPSECVANARLIAAAPDLLAVVEMVNRIWSHDQTENLHPESPAAILRAALKKAKGEG